MSTVHGNKSYAGVWGNKSLTLSYEHFHAAHEMRRRVGGELAASLAALQRLEVGSSIARGQCKEIAPFSDFSNTNQRNVNPSQYAPVPHCSHPGVLP